MSVKLLIFVCSLHMFVRSNEENYLFLCLCLFVDYREKKKRNKELKLGKLEYHRSTKESIYHISTIFFNLI